MQAVRPEKLRVYPQGWDLPPSIPSWQDIICMESQLLLELQRTHDRHRFKVMWKLGTIV